MNDNLLERSLLLYSNLPVPQSKFLNPLIGPTHSDKIDTLCFCSAVAYANVSSSYPDCSSWYEMSFIIRVSCLCGETLIIKPDPWRTIILQKWGKLVLVSELGSWNACRYFYYETWKNTLERINFMSNDRKMILLSDIKGLMLWHWKMLLPWEKGSFILHYTI